MDNIAAGLDIPLFFWTVTTVVRKDVVVFRPGLPSAPVPGVG